MAKIPLFRDLYYTYRGIQLYKSMLKKSCYWSKAEMEAYQYGKLKSLLMASHLSVPYYQQLFDEIGFNPERDFQSLADLAKIPVLDKNFVKQNKALFLNKKYEKNALTFKTSGSTGMPLEVLVHEDQWIMEQGVVWRHWKWGGYNFRDPLAMVRSFVPPDENTLWRTNRMTNFTFYSPFHLNDKNIALYLDHMIDNGTVILRGYPSSIATMADYVLRSGHAVPKIKLILTASEVLTDTDRSRIESAFKAKVSNHYGLAEQIVMMGDCEKHEGLHNYDEYGYLELLDTDDPQIKRIIGTNLNNLTTPFIRYDTGDLAVLADKPCSCGKTLPTIKNIIGRKDAVIKTAEGFEIPTVNFYTMFEDFQELERWQIVQRSLTELDFNVRTPHLSDERRAALEQAIKRRLNESMTVNINVNVDFIQKNEGKINSFISLLQA